jgi:hypothetical protein
MALSLTPIPCQVKHPPLWAQGRLPAEHCILLHAAGTCQILSCHGSLQFVPFPRGEFLYDAGSLVCNCLFSCSGIYQGFFVHVCTWRFSANVSKITCFSLWLWCLEIIKGFCGCLSTSHCNTPPASILGLARVDALSYTTVWELFCKCTNSRIDHKACLFYYNAF